MRGPVQKVLSETIKERLEGTTYDPLRSAQIAKELADMIKERTKNLGYERHKLARRRPFSPFSPPRVINQTRRFVFTHTPRRPRFRVTVPPRLDAVSN